LDLKDEVRDIIDWFVKVTDGLSEPDKHKVCLLFGVSGDELLNFVLKQLGFGGQVLLDRLGVEMKQSDVGGAWKLGLEVGRVVLQELQRV